jgi:hypothetical protein
MGVLKIMVDTGKRWIVVSHYLKFWMMNKVQKLVNNEGK